MKKIALLLVVGLFTNISFAQLAFDRSRIIFNAGKSKSQTVVISNNSSDAPFLAQTWIENDRGEKIVSPLAALPILQRINPKQDKQVKVNFMGSAAELASDRETMFFMNVLGVPPKGDANANEVSIVIQTKMKLFYRPQGLPTYELPNGWIEEVVVKKEGRTITLENPTAYHSVIYGILNSRNVSVEQDITLKPFSSQKVDIQVGNKFFMMFIDDFGGPARVNYTCNGNVCNGVRELPNR